MYPVMLTHSRVFNLNIYIMKQTINAINERFKVLVERSNMVNKLLPINLLQEAIIQILLETPLEIIEDEEEEEDEDILQYASPESYWTSTDGTHTKVKDIYFVHLLNIIRKLERNGYNQPAIFNERWLRVLRAELESRNQEKQENKKPK